MNETAAPKRTTPIEKENGAKPDRNILDQVVEQTIKREILTWKVADTGEELRLSISHVRKLFANPTKSNKMPSDRDCWLFLQLCKARGLNPYLGDAFLVGYDERDGTSKFSLITAHQALLKRAEASGKKKGMESGVIVRDKETKELKETHGDFVDDGDSILGGWCKVYRNDYDLPIYERVKLATYNKGYSRWSADPAGMIVKVAEASAHRLAFPAETGGMYVHEELDGMQNSESAPEPKPQNRTVSVADLKGKSKARPDETSQLPPIESENVSQDEPSFNLEDPPPPAGADQTSESAAAEKPQPEASRGPVKPAKSKPVDAADLRGPASPAWTKFNEALGRMDDDGIKVIRVMARLPFTPWTELRTPQLEHMTQLFTDHIVDSQQPVGAGK